MLKLEVDGKCAVFLDHWELIKTAYHDHCDEGSLSYELRQEIFNYDKRKKDVEAESKRKKSSNDEELNTDLQQLCSLSSTFLRLLHEQSVFPKNTSSELPRCWEELHEFPQFHGANETREFQTFAFQKNTYLVPPRCRFFNHDLMQLTQLLPQLSTDAGYDLVVLDPPWRNKYIRRVKRARLEHAYTMLDTMQLQELPLARVLHRRSLVAIWCTNSERLQHALVQELLPAWQLRLVHKLPWCKLNTQGELVSAVRQVGNKQPFEMLYIAAHRESDVEMPWIANLQQVDMLLSVPSLVHSHKPPLLPWLEDFLSPAEGIPRCLELFARYLQPQFTSIGLEVLKLMDLRLYRKKQIDKDQK